MKCLGLKSYHFDSNFYSDKIIMQLINSKIYPDMRLYASSSLIEILWADLTFKQQSSRIYRSAGTPVVLLSTLVYSEVALDCLQSGKSGNFVA